MAEVIVVHGVAGSGKTTQSERLINLECEKYFHVSAGNRLRGIRTGQIESALSPQILAPSLSKPMMLDHEIINGVVLEYVSSCPGESVVLVDGYPRFADAVGIFVESLRGGNHVFRGCINFDLSRETSIERSIRRGTRGGEGGEVTAEFVSGRYDDYLRYTMPAIRGLEKEAVVLTINAEPPVEVVWNSFRRAFFQLISQG